MSDGKTHRRMNEREWECFEDGVKWERARIIKLLETQWLPIANVEACLAQIKTEETND